MNKPAPDMSDDAWLEQFFSRTSDATKAPAFRPAQLPSERKAAESTRVSREMTEAATNQRQATTAKLKAARLEKEADARALAAQKPKTKAGSRGRKG